MLLHRCGTTPTHELKIYKWRDVDFASTYFYIHWLHVSLLRTPDHLSIYPVI